MRITGGQCGGHRLRMPTRGAVRPTQDRVREALFSILASRVPDARFLDLFAGSGSVGLEAASRGAAFVCWVERSRRVLPVLRANAECVQVRLRPGAGGGLTEGRVVCTTAMAFLRAQRGADPFDIVFADPPYRDDVAASQALAEAARASGALAPGGVFILEQDAGRAASPCEGWEIEDERVYGQTRLVFYAGMSETGEKKETEI